jgi:two-component system catabolic regulation response regulator CreB
MAQRILVVEDEPAIADNISYALSTEGFDVCWCATAAEAEEALQKISQDLVVLDVGLPDRSGFELCRAIRRHSDVPVIFLTARADEVDRVVGLEIGADDYMVKPFSPRELTARIKAVLRRTRATGEPECRLSAHPAFRVDRNRMEIVYEGVALDLSRYEFRLLEVLVNRPGWVFSREQLMSMAWEEPEASMDRTVDTHIKTLRMKLKAVRPDADPIRTHRGLGYSLKAPR